MDLVRRNNEVFIHLCLAHGLDDDLFAFDFLESRHRVALGLEGADEVRAVAAKFLADDRLYPVIDDIFRDAGALFLHFLELLDDELAVDEILHRSGAHFRNFCGKLISRVGFAQGTLAGADQLAHLRNGDHVLIDDSRHAINDLRLLGVDSPGHDGHQQKS